MHTRYAPALILVLLIAGCGKGAAPGTDKTDSRQQLETRLKQLVSDRVMAAETARSGSLAAYQTETGTLDNVLLAIDALWKAKLGAANTADQRIAAHVERIEYLWQLQISIEHLFRKGLRGGEAEKMYRMEYGLADAEIALIDECVAEGQPYPAALAKLQNRRKVSPGDDEEVEAVKP